MEIPVQNTSIEDTGATPKFIPPIGIEIYDEDSKRRVMEIIEN